MVRAQRVAAGLAAEHRPAKQEKNRFHPDLRLADGDVDKAVARLLELGARHADVGQTGDEAFVVLADPEDNEFCVLKQDPTIR